MLHLPPRVELNHVGGPGVPESSTVVAGWTPVNKPKYVLPEVSPRNVVHALRGETSDTTLALDGSEKTNSRRHPSHVAESVESSGQSDDESSYDESPEPVKKLPLRAKQEPYSHDQNRCWFTQTDNQPCETHRPMRKVVSHYYGRNKCCTRAIPDEATVYVCRPHYQRAHYQSRIHAAKSNFTLALVQAQFEMIRNLSPDLTWEIAFQNNLNKAYKEFQNGVLPPRDADIVRPARRKRSVPGSNVDKKPIRQRPRAQLYSQEQLELIQTELVPRLGTGKTMAEVQEFLEVVESALTADFCELPEFELLPQYL